MAVWSNLKLMTAIVVLLSVSKEADAGEPQNQAIAESVGQGKIECILTDRLAGRQLRLWSSIREVVFAKDESGRLKHPKLSALWHDADTSGHVIQIELSHYESFRAGQFSIENFDSNNRRYIAVIRLNLSVIDGASVRKSARRPDGLIPFAGLRAVERYAEVLGHELAHVVRAFQDPQYLRLYQEVERERRELKYGPHGLIRSTPDQEARWRRLEKLIREIEKPAEAAEMEIWRELRMTGAIRAPGSQQ